MALGDAVVTSAGDMPGPDYLIHVAGLNLRWKATSAAVAVCARNAVLAAAELGITSMAMPLIGAGTGGLTRQDSRAAIAAGLEEFPTAADTGEPIDVVIITQEPCVNR